MRLGVYRAAVRAVASASYQTHETGCVASCSWYSSKRLLPNKRDWVCGDLQSVYGQTPPTKLSDQTGCVASCSQYSGKHLPTKLMRLSVYQAAISTAASTSYQTGETGHVTSCSQYRGKHLLPTNGLGVPV